MSEERLDPEVGVGEDVTPSAEEILEEHLSELEEAYAEVGFFRRISRMVKGLGRPHASAEYKLARTELQRLAAPVVAVVAPVVFLAQSDMENCQAFKEELQSDRNRVFRLVTGGTGA